MFSTLFSISGTNEARGRSLSVRGHVAWVKADYAAARDAYRPNLQLVQFSNDAGTG